MFRKILFTLIIFSLISFSCSSRKNKVDHKNLIPENEFINIMTDFYLTDGLLSLSRIQNLYTPTDTLGPYADVIEKHGYNKEIWDKTIKYYFIKKPKELIKIYDLVLGRLSEQQSLYEKEVILHQTRISNLWKGPDSYFFPDYSGVDTSNFEMTVENRGTYFLTFSASLSPIDEAVNPHPTVYTCHPDSIKTGKRNYVKSINYIKDGYPHTYSIEINLSDTPLLHIGGQFYDSDNCPDASARHLRIVKISLTYLPGSL